jgi:hypothetical protein
MAAVSENNALFILFFLNARALLACKLNLGKFLDILGIHISCIDVHPLWGILVDGVILFQSPLPARSPLLGTEQPTCLMAYIIMGVYMFYSVPNTGDPCCA